MINRFDQSLDKGYVSNYMPLPFNELQAMAAQQQKAYDTTLDDSYKLQDFMATIPEVNDPMLGLNNTSLKRSIDNEYSSKIEELTNRIAKGNDFLGAQRDLNNLKRKIANDPRIIGLRNQRAQYDLYKNDITKKGGKYDSRLDDYAGTQLVTQDGQQALPFNYHGMEDSLDREKKFREAMGDLKEDIKGWDVEYLGSDGIKIGNKGKQAGITPEKVMAVARQKVGFVLNGTDEGKQFVKIERRNNPNITNEELIQKATQAMFSTASNQIFSEKSSGNSYDVTSMWGKKYDEAKEAQMASTTPEVLNLIDNGNTLPEGLNKFYHNGQLDLGDRVGRFLDIFAQGNPGLKAAYSYIKNNVTPEMINTAKNSTQLISQVLPAVQPMADLIANNEGWINQNIKNKAIDSQEKKAIEYSSELFENAAKISGLTKTQVSKIYNQEEQKGAGQGFEWLQGYVESHYNNVSLQKNTVATFQNTEQNSATLFFLGPKLSKDQAESGIGSNIRASEITDLNGNIITDKEGINSNNYNVSGISFQKPGQIVLSGNDGKQLLVTTNYESLKKMTKPVVDIDKDAINYLKTFKLSESSKNEIERDLGYKIKGNKAPSFSFNYKGNTIDGELTGIKNYKINDNNYDVSTIVSRVYGTPMAFINYVETDNNGNKINEETLPLEDFKTMTVNKIIANPEFRGINKQKENKVDFE